MNLSTIRSLFLVTMALPLAAQGPTTFTAVRTQNYGVNQAGGSTTLRASATVDASLGGATLDVGLSNVASVRLFGFTREAAAMVGAMNARHTIVGFSQNGPLFLNTSTGSYVVRLGGFTVLSASSFALGVSGNLTADVFPGNGVSRDVSLLGFNVRVLGQVGARAQYTLTPTLNFANFAIDIDGPLRSSAVGEAGCSVSFLGASAGVSGTLTYANTNGVADLRVTPAGASGTIAYTVQQIRLVLRVFASLALPFLPEVSDSLTLFDQSTNAQAGTLNLVQN